MRRLQSWVVADDNDPDHNVPSAKLNYVAYSRAGERLVVLRVKLERRRSAWGALLERATLHSEGFGMLIASNAR